RRSSNPAARNRNPIASLRRFDGVGVKSFIRLADGRSQSKISIAENGTRRKDGFKAVGRVGALPRAANWSKFGARPCGSGVGAFGLRYRVGLFRKSVAAQTHRRQPWRAQRLCFVWPPPNWVCFSILQTAEWHRIVVFSPGCIRGFVRLASLRRRQPRSLLLAYGAPPSGTNAAGDSALEGKEFLGAPARCAEKARGATYRLELSML